jgi:hypothetical protein
LELQCGVLDLVGNTKMGETGLLLTLSRHTGIQGHSVLISSITLRVEIALCIKIGAKSCEALELNFLINKMRKKANENIMVRI